eukprot:INCI17127.2.p1 GENE.INCI17127.2~~INCI17127.2.p1  ORF type:complete len:670 (+),score=152.15 INCI17127.2:132-2141(+)
MEQNALALHIIREHFGIAVECVFEMLAKHGRLSAFALLQELPRQHFDANTMFHILAILLQQNLLIVRRVRGTIQYAVDIQAALNRIRFPHFMALVKSQPKYPPECEEIFRVLLLNGRLGADSVCRHAALKFEPSGRDDPKGQPFLNKLASIRRLFHKMLEDGFIARVEPLDQDTIFNFAGKTKGAGSSSKSGNGGSANGSGGGSSSAGSSAAKSSAGRNGHGTTASPSVRGVKGSARGASTKSAKSSKNKKKARPQEAAAGFAAIMGLMTSAEVKTEGKRRKKKKKPATPRDQDPAATGETDDSSPGRKRARRSVKEDSGLASLAAAAKAAADAASVADAPSTIALFKRATFRCNVDMCMQKMERQILMGQMAIWTKQAGGGPMVAQAGLAFLPNVFSLVDSRAKRKEGSDALDEDEDSGSGKRKKRDAVLLPSTMLLTQRDLSRCCGAGADGATVDAIMNLLDQHGALTPVESRSNRSMRYALDTSAFLREMVNQTIFDVMRRKFSLLGLRVFRLLVKLKYAEAKDLGRQAMLSIRDTRKTLYELRKQDFVSVQEVPKRADRNVKHSFFLWHVNMPAVLRSIRNQCQQSILRYRVKRQLLFEGNQVLMQRKQRGVEVNDEEALMFQQFMTSLGLLDESVLNTDNTYMLFQFYNRHLLAELAAKAEASR